MPRRRGLLSGRGAGLALLCVLPSLALSVWFFQRYYPQHWVWMDDVSRAGGGGLVQRPGSLGTLVGLSVGLVLALWLAGLLLGPKHRARAAQNASAQPGCLGILLILAASALLMRPLAWILRTYAQLDIGTWGHGLAFLWLALTFLGFALVPVLRMAWAWVQRS